VDSKELRELIELISRSSFSTFELEREGFRLRLVKAGAVVAAEAPRVAEGTAAVVQPTAAPPAVEVQAPASNGLVELQAPIVGTFYRAQGPDAPPFVDVGSRVRRGQVICIVEAMKVMNEIESEIDAEVVEIPVTNGQPVEYGEVLFRLRPLA
jgi:acetyl-CoA carboxylase biotin carboxyl carrier protein